jgi:peptidyl-prolyl cis-trans isomerase B (cyclophilin B)
VTSTRERQQRAAARAKLARDMAERQEAAKRRRQRHAMLGAGGAVVVVLAAVVWVVTALGGDAEPAPEPPIAADTPAPDSTPAAPGECVWLPEDNPDNPHLVDVGTPEVGEPPTGPATMTITTNHGVIEVEMDAPNAPCNYASFVHLASQQFYDGTSCHRLTTAESGISVLQCGDPSGTGQGGPTYRYAEENLPTGGEEMYPPGTLAMAKTQAPSSTGSQFFIVYDQSALAPDYTVVGTVTQGMDIVEQIAAGGLGGDGIAPAIEVIIESLRVSDPA